MILPFAPGGGTDLVGRVLAQKMTESLGQPVVVDNRPGANSNIGNGLAARSAPDGYTIIFASSSITINPSVYKTVPYDPLKDFAPVSLAAKVPFILLVHPSLPVRSLPDLIKFVRAHKGELTYGSAGIGNPSHLGMELLKIEAKIDMVHVPYKGGGPMTTDLIGGHVQLIWGTVLPSLPHIKAGRVRALALGGLKRVNVAPNVPTMAELGYPGLEVVTWNGVLAPAGTPGAIVSRLSQDVSRALNSPDMNNQLVTAGAEPAGNTPEQFAAFIKAEIVKWSTAVKAAGIERL